MIVCLFHRPITDLPDVPAWYRRPRTSEINDQGILAATARTKTIQECGAHFCTAMKACAKLDTRSNDDKSWSEGASTDLPWPQLNFSYLKLWTHFLTARPKKALATSFAKSCTTKFHHKLPRRSMIQRGSFMCRRTVLRHSAPCQAL